MPSYEKVKTCVHIVDVLMSVVMVFFTDIYEISLSRFEMIMSMVFVLLLPLMVMVMVCFSCLVCFPDVVFGCLFDLGICVLQLWQGGHPHSQPVVMGHHMLQEGSRRCQVSLATGRLRRDSVIMPVCSRILSIDLYLVHPSGRILAELHL